MPDPLALGRDDAVFTWSTDHEPRLTVRSGQEIAFDMWDASGGQLGPSATLDEFLALDHKRTMPISGPVYVEGANAGDTLEVEILEVAAGGYGWTGQRPAQGILDDAEFDREWVHVWRVDGELAWFNERIAVPVEPFPGMIGVTPADAGEHSSDPPRTVGGNLDTKQLVSGTTLYLPVAVEGALFGIGDGHAAQGDGEVCGSAVEVPMSAVVRLSVRRDFRVEAPEFVVRRPLERSSAAAAGYYVTTGVDPDLYAAARQAVRAMVRYLVDRRGLDPQDAYCLCSVAADLKVSEIVDWPNLLVSAFLPLDIFREPD
jgi:acetamidase/formamidase